MRVVKLAGTALSVVALSACTIYEDSSARDLPSGPGGNPWEEDIACQHDDECSEGEFCDNGSCQMRRCEGSYESLLPMGQNHYFGTDGEMAIISDGSFVDAFGGDDGAYLNSWDLGGDTVVDVAGGALNPQRPHVIAVARQYSDRILLHQNGSVDELAVGIWPEALAAGDVDADGLDELVAFAADGTIALCDVDTGQCSGAVIDGATGKDVAVADVDGDGFEEPIFLFEHTEATQLVIWNVDFERTEQDESYGWEFNFGIKAISAGDLDGDFTAEVVALEDGGWFGLADDKLHVFSPSAGEILGTADVDGHCQDVAVGDRDSDDVAEAVILREDQHFEMYESSSTGVLESAAVWPVTVGEEAQRISMVDWDGDSASGRLLEGPNLVSGYEVPVGVLVFPPYPRGAAQAVLSASIMIGNTERTDETYTDSVSLHLGMAVSYGADFGSLAKAKVGAYFNQDFTYTQTVTKSKTVGGRYSLHAAPDIYGTDYGAVILSCGCYHQYRYAIEDPADRIGGSDQVMDLYIPVGGQTILLSSKRYNKMADASEHLPHVDMPYTVGDVTSYPRTPERLDGTPIGEDDPDMLFPNSPSFQVSDVGFLNFWLAMGENESNGVAVTSTIGVTGSLGAAGLNLDVNVGLGVTQGYSLGVGTDAIFAGGIPPIPDNPATPEDEYLVHRYAFRPVVYRQHYQTPSGEDAAFYVLTHAVVSE